MSHFVFPVSATSHLPAPPLYVTPECNCQPALLYICTHPFTSSCPLPDSRVPDSSIPLLYSCICFCVRDWLLTLPFACSPLGHPCLITTPSRCRTRLDLTWPPARSPNSWVDEQESAILDSACPHFRCLLIEDLLPLNHYKWLPGDSVPWSVLINLLKFKLLCLDPELESTSCTRSDSRWPLHFLPQTGGSKCLLIFSNLSRDGQTSLT